jgi:hypothetical protein
MIWQTENDSSVDIATDSRNPNNGLLMEYERLKADRLRQITTRMHRDNLSVSSDGANTTTEELERLAESVEEKAKLQLDAEIQAIEQKSADMVAEFERSVFPFAAQYPCITSLSCSFSCKHLAGILILCDLTAALGKLMNSWNGIL